MHRGYDRQERRIIDEEGRNDLRVRFARTHGEKPRLQATRIRPRPFRDDGNARTVLLLSRLELSEHQHVQARERPERWRDAVDRRGWTRDRDPSVVRPSAVERELHRRGWRDAEMPREKAGTHDVRPRLMGLDRAQLVANDISERLRPVAVAHRRQRLRDRLLFVEQAVEKPVQIDVEDAQAVSPSVCPVRILAALLRDLEHCDFDSHSPRALRQGTRHGTARPVQLRLRREDLLWLAKGRTAMQQRGCGCREVAIGMPLSRQPSMNSHGAPPPVRCGVPRIGRPPNQFGACSVLAGA